MKIISILSVLFSGIVLSACGTSPEEVVINPPIEIVTVETKSPAPIVPSVDRLRLRTVEWEIVTAENATSVLTEGVALFTLTAEGYENLSLNLSEISALIQQQQEIIAIYKDSYK